MSKQHIPSQKM